MNSTVNDISCPKGHIVDELHVALVQPNLHWLNPQANLDHLSQLLTTIPSATDLIVLPEMFTSGFTQQPEPLYGDQKAIRWMKEHAKAHHAAITGSVACEIETTEKNGCAPVFVNRLFFVFPNGDVCHYDKCHLFQMGGEHKRYQAGKERCIVNYKGWHILLSICYDLRFPVFCRQQSNDYELMLCVANWPQSRQHPWRVLLQARAIENQAYVLGVNRVGVDGNGLEYNGDSMAIDCYGNILADGGCGSEQVLTTVLKKGALERARNAFPVLNDADSFKLL